MYNFMNRASVKKLRTMGWSLRKISRELGMHRGTVKRLLDEPLTQVYKRRAAENAASPYRGAVVEWLEAGTPVKRMLELVRADEEEPFGGSRAAFYAGVARIREKVEAINKDRYVRFEGLPGEYAQVDWGEVRAMPFLRGGPRKKYFLAVRLKFSRFSFVKWTDSMTQEVLIRGLVESFEAFNGAPWGLVFDNMKTVTLGRDEHGRPIWHPVLKHFANDFNFMPEACDRASGNQKGSVENLVGWVKSNFLPERTFLDDADLERQNSAWTTEVNGQVSQAHGEIPREILPEEQKLFGKLVHTAADYGLLRPVTSNRDGYVHLLGFQYLIPIGLAEQPLLARIRETKVEFYDAGDCVVSYPRRRKGDGKSGKREFLPELLEPLLAERPKARVMVYRDFLCQQHPEIASYISKLCHARRGVEQYGPHILTLYEMLKEYGVGELMAACNLTAIEGAFGGQYVERLLKEPSVVRPVIAKLQLGPEVPSQDQIDRDLEFYESYVIGGGDHG